jgi:hypothetical protein
MRYSVADMLLRQQVNNGVAAVFWTYISPLFFMYLIF